MGLSVHKINQQIIDYQSLLVNDFSELTRAEIKKQKSENKKNMARIKYLQQILLYLETNPSEDYLISERERLGRLIKTLEENFPNWSKHNAPADIDVKKRKPFYNKEMGINKMKLQLRTVNEILT